MQMPHAAKDAGSCQMDIELMVCLVAVENDLLLLAQPVENIRHTLQLVPRGRPREPLHVAKQHHWSGVDPESHPDRLADLHHPRMMIGIGQAGDDLIAIFRGGQCPVGLLINGP